MAVFDAIDDGGHFTHVHVTFDFLFKLTDFDIVQRNVLYWLAGRKELQTMCI